MTCYTLYVAHAPENHSIVPRFGIVLPNRGPIIETTTVEELLEGASHAEAGGWDSVWVGDSLLAKPRLDAISLLGALAATTRTVWLGVACMASLPLRHPVELAHQWATLDLISGGRMILGACQGGGPGSGEFDAELSAFGVDRRDRSRRLEETIDVLRALWAGDEVSHQGEFWSFEGVSVYPKPAQRRPPIWVAANPDLAKPRNVASALGRVARLGDGWQTTHSHPDEVSKMLAIIGELAAEHGRHLDSEFPVCVTLNLSLGESREEAMAEAKRFLDRHSLTDYTADFLAKWVAAGTPTDCAEFAARYVEAGATWLLFRPVGRGLVDQIDQASEELLPLLRP